MTTEVSKTPITPDLVARTPEVEPQPEPETKVEFSPAQQAKLEEIIREVSGRVGGDLRKKLAVTEAELAKERAEKELFQKASQPDALESDKLRAENAQLRSQNEEQAAAMRRTARENHIREAALRERFVDPNDALRFVDLPDDATPEQIAEAVSKVASQKSHLIRGSVPSGSGSTESRGGMIPVSLNPQDYYGRNSKPGAAEQLNALSRSNPQAYRALRDAAKKARLC